MECRRIGQSFRRNNLLSLYTIIMKNKCFKLIATLSYVVINFLCYAQTPSSPATLTGSGNFIVPCGVTSITVKCWGGGGAGQGDNTNNTIGGGGGGSGAYCTSTIVVTPGQSFAYSVGVGGTANSTSTFNASQNGTASTFGTLSAGGGSGGNGSAGGAGGVASGGTINTNGVAGSNNAAGAGGNGGGPAPGSGGAASNGGADGSSAAGGGAAPGGGGGGAGDATVLGVVVQSKASGAGGAGSITVTFTVNGAGPDQNLAACATSGTLAATAVPVGSVGTWTCVTNCGGVTIANPTSPSSTFSGLTVPNATTFRWTVTDDPGVAGGVGCTTTTDDVVINTLTGPLCPVYCVQDADQNCSSFSEAITAVSFKTISNSGTGCTEPGTSTTVTPGSTSPITISTTGSGTYDLTIHIDWNADGDFADAGEYIILGDNVAPGTFSGNISVPAGAACGATVKMRIIWNYGTTSSQATACATNLTYGETEDYSILISCCTPDCSNGIQDCNELGVDCGGPCGSACPGVASCTDAIQNQDEVGVDCGGLICAPCGAPCATFSSPTSTPASGSIIDASSADQTIDACIEVTYSNRGTNWLHGVFINPATTGFVSSTGINGPPEPNTTAGAPPATYKWSNQTANFTGQTSGNSISQDGWFVETGTVNTNPGNNLGWPVGAGVTLGPFCFRTTLSCSGLQGDVAGSLSFQTTGDSYSGSWTTVDCGKETSFGANVINYTLRCPVPLPIELLSFNAKYDGRNVKVFWSTQTEIENDHFEVYKSNDGIKFEKLGENVKGAPGGYSNAQRNYELLDKNPSSEMTYYKLRQYDFNGEFKESKIIGIISPMTLKEIAVIPNPVKEIATIIFKTNDEFSTKIKVYDVSGKEQFTSTIDTQYGINSFSFPTDHLSNGIYFIDISNEVEIQKIKFIKEN